MPHAVPVLCCEPESLTYGERPRGARPQKENAFDDGTSETADRG